MENVEAVCFLLFLAAYKLAWYFDQDEIFSVFGRMRWSLPATELLMILGMKSSIPIRQFLGYLVSENQPLKALRCIEVANVFESHPSAKARLSAYVLKPSTGRRAEQQLTLRDLKKKLAIWKDVEKHNMADEKCKAYILDLEKQKQTLQGRKYSRYHQYSSYEPQISLPVSSSGLKSNNIASCSTPGQKHTGSGNGDAATLVATNLQPEATDNVAVASSTLSSPLPQPRDDLPVVQQHKRKKVSS